MNQAFVESEIAQRAIKCRRFLGQASLWAALGALLPIGVAAQSGLSPLIAPAEQIPAPDSGNTLNRSNSLAPLARNPERRSGIPDTAPVQQDLRDSTSRPTLPAAPDTLDVRDAILPTPDSTRFNLPNPSGAVPAVPEAAGPRR